MTALPHGLAVRSSEVVQVEAPSTKQALSQWLPALPQTRLSQEILGVPVNNANFFQ